MLKRIIISILSVVMAATMLCGCSFFTHNNERDYRQVIANVYSYDISNDVVEKTEDEQGKEVETTVTKTYTTTARTIYKLDLVEYINNNGSSLSQTYTDAESLTKHAMEMLVDVELITNEVDALIYSGLIKWGTAEKNAVKKRVYSVIDSSIVSIKNTILEERSKPTADTENEEPSTSTTYPTKPIETADDEDKADETAWEPSLSAYPGLYGNSDMRSLEREAMRRFIQVLKNRVADDFRVTAEDKAKFKEDDKAIDKVINEKGVEYVYGMLGDTHYVYYISGKNIERSQKINALQTYLTESVTVSTQEVAASYNAMLNSQMSLYNESEAAYDTAASGSSTILYRPNNKYFYVKHILLPFSEAQTAELNAYKAKLNVSEDSVKAFRAKLAEAIVAYPHVAGENDMSRPMSVKEVINEIKAKMLPLEGDVKKADLMFDDLIYLYNTDPGAFGNNTGYVVKDDDEGNSYMQEFTDGARYMISNLSVGEVYYEPVVTDYGVHIMYLAQKTKVGAVGLYDYTTPGEVETYYDLLEKPIRSARESAAYNSWEANVLNYNYNDSKKVKIMEERYKNLWEK